MFSILTELKVQISFPWWVRWYLRALQVWAWCGGEVDLDAVGERIANSVKTRLL